MSVTETTIQAILMRWLMNECNHQLIIPNSTVFFSWEADLISVTKAGLTHEYEIKINRADYNKDAKKWKHHAIGNLQYAPAYFWYVTYGFLIEPPEKTGWILISKYPERHNLVLEIKKTAPRLNNWKPPDRKLIALAHGLSWRISNIYKRYIEEEEN